jgi:hypothetical protein
VAGGPTGEEPSVGALDRRPRGEYSARQIERRDESYKACAAASSSSKSGTCPVS